MDVSELGRLFKKQREHLGLNLAEVSDSTRISRRILEILESGDRESFPHPVYAKGFIRNYARVLKLNPEECVQALEHELQNNERTEEDGTCHPSLSERADNQVVVPCRSSWPSLFGAVLLVALLAVSIWYFSFASEDAASEGHGAATVEQVAHDTAASQATTLPAPAEKIPAPAQDAEPSDSGTGDEAGDEAGNAHISVQASASVNDSRTVPAAVTMQDDVADTGHTLHTLTITVVGDDSCWVGVWIPGSEELAKDFTVEAGKSVNYRFRGKRLVRFGRMESVRLLLDGEDRPTKGTGVVNLTLP